MKKILALAMLLAFVTPIEASANCGPGQTSGVEINVTTGAQRNYCGVFEPQSVPTQQELETKIQESISQTITNQKNVNAPIIFTETEIIFETESITEVLKIMEVNATTGEVITREYSSAEYAQAAIDRSQWRAQQEAQKEAKRLASENQGTTYCINWFSNLQSGTECGFDPIPATEEEVQAQYSALQELMAFNWSEFLQLWR